MITNLWNRRRRKGHGKRWSSATDRCHGVPAKQTVSNQMQLGKSTICCQAHSAVRSDL